MSARSLPNDLEPRPNDPRILILAQHQTLRRFLAGAIEIADAALCQDEIARALLSYTILGLRVAFERHVLTEEAVMLPVLEVELPLGPERIASWRREHSRQLRALADIAEGGVQDAGLIAAGLRSLATDLLRGIAEEERTLLSSAYFRQLLRRREN